MRLLPGHPRTDQGVNMKLTNEQSNLKDNIQEDLVKITYLEEKIKANKKHIKNIVSRINNIFTALNTIRGYL